MVDLIKIGLARDYLLLRFKSYPYFILVGLVGAGSILFLTYVLTDLLKFWYFSSYVFATVSGWTLVFVLNHKITFQLKLKDLRFRHYIKFLGMYGVVGLVNFTAVFVLTSIFGLYYILSVVLVVVPVSVFNFLMNQHYIFNSNLNK